VRWNGGKQRFELSVNLFVVCVSEPEAAESENLIVRVVGFPESVGVILESFSKHVASCALGFLHILAILLQVSFCVCLVLWKVGAIETTSSTVR